MVPVSGIKRMAHANGLSIQPAEASWTVANGVRALVMASRSPSTSQRRRLRLGAIGVDIRGFPKLQPTQINVRPNAALLVVPLKGHGELITETLHATADITHAVLLARPGMSTLVWTPGSEGVILHWPRVRAQILASRRLDLPVRLGVRDAVLPLALSEHLGPLVASLVEEADGLPALTEERERLWIDQLEAAFTTLLINTPGREAILPVSRSIRRAVQHVRDNAETDMDAASVATISGVAPRTLREGFRACLGVSLSAFIQETRLKKARERLESAHDPRAMSEIATAAGFGSPSSFSRAYLRVFGETPSRTRANSVGQTGAMWKIE